MQQAQHTLAREGLSRLSLAVDSTNTPALHLYFRHGMQRLGSRIAMMRVLSTAPPHVR
jgi:ribosomal protein S18 acetylase RimI-like enzyme